VEVVSRWETGLSVGEHEALSRLLAAAFPRAADIFGGQSWNLARKEARLWLAEDGRPVAHLAVQRRLIGTAAGDMLVAGVGEVAVAPDRQRDRLGTALVHALSERLRGELAADVAFLVCAAPVAGFYTRTGWTQVDNTMRYLAADAVTVREDTPIAMILPGRRPVTDWPGGLIDLRGQIW
jgi:nodulation protein A